nr:cytochrome c biogenesis FN [Plantago media]
MPSYEACHFAFFSSLFLILTYNKRQSLRFGATLAFWSILLSSLGLVFSHISTNLANSNVASAPFFYQISGTWSNHEGSLLLWCWILTFYTFLFWQRPKYERIPCSTVFLYNFFAKKPSYPISSQSCQNPQPSSALVTSIPVFFTLFLVASSNPFLRNFYTCTEPLAEFNPVLQDPILAIHPPCIYAGALASAIVFILSVSRMKNTILVFYVKRRHQVSFTSWSSSMNTVIYSESLEIFRIWLLVSWIFLTLGIMLGSWWAYHELGWGGWWFWDPVENASLLPWLLVTAAIHTVSLPKLDSWTSFLSILTFLSVVLGTFTIRSGLLSSVHSFATDDNRGLFLWWFFVFLSCISLILFVQVKQVRKLQITS